MDQITIILTVLALVGLALYYYKQFRKYKREQNKQTWPKDIAPCPDYWVHEGNNKCKNIFNIGTGPRQNGEIVAQGTYDFNSSRFKGDDGQRQKCIQVRRWGNSWEGVDKLCD